MREKLNIYRRARGKKLPKNITTHEYPIFDNTVPKMKFKIKKERGGDLKQDLDDYPTEEQIYTQIKPKSNQKFDIIANGNFEKFSNLSN